VVVEIVDSVTWIEVPTGVDMAGVCVTEASDEDVKDALVSTEVLSEVEVVVADSVVAKPIAEEAFEEETELLSVETVSLA